MLVDQRQGTQVVFEQRSAAQLRQYELRQRLHFVVGTAAHDVVCRDVARVAQASGLHQLLQGMQRLLVKVVHPVGFVRHHQRLLTQRVLRGYACGAGPGVAVLRLDAAQRKHEAACAIAPVGANGHQPRNVKRADHFAGTPDADPVAQVHTPQGVVHQQQAFLQR